jgi:triacylglycerol lipase
MGEKLEIALGALNGVLGDHLARTNNGLAIEMQCIHDGAPLALEPAAISRAHRAPSGRLVVLVHGSMCTENIWQQPDGSDFGTLLERDFGSTPYRVRYNSGLAIADNGLAFSRLLEELVGAHPVPVEEIMPIGFSMGGLVIRSACHAASAEGTGWLPLVRRTIYIGTPHRGALLERVGRVVTRLLRGIDDPYTELLAKIGDLRSDGVKDLGDADLRHADRARRVERLALRDPTHPVPLLSGIQHYLIAGSLSGHPWLAALFGDSVVPVPSATDGHCRDRPSMALPPSHVKLLTGVAHLDLARHPDVYAQVRAWCEQIP